MSKVQVTLLLDEKTYQLWQKTAEDYEELPEDYNPDDYAGGNMDDAFQNGEEHGWDSAITEVIGRVVSVEVV